MNAWRLTKASLRHYWRTQLGVVLGVLCAATVLVGALTVGDSVRLSLREQALQRIGGFDAALTAGDRFVTVALADRIAAAIEGSTCAPIVQVPGVANSRRKRSGDQGSSELRTGLVDVYGVDARFFAMAPTQSTPATAIPPGRAYVNERLARQLQIDAGDEFVVRVERPSLMPREATMATVDDVAFALRVTVDRVLQDGEFGRFGLRASQVPPFNVFLDRAWLNAELELEDRANLLAIDATPAAADRALRTHWTLADAELELGPIPADLDGSATNPEIHALTSGRVFLDPAIGDTVRAIAPDGLAILTYFVNSIAAGERVTPYSTVTALGPLDPTTAPAAPLAATARLAPEGDELVIHDWLAKDIGAEPGAELVLSYYVMDEQLQLDERTHAMRVSAIVELANAALDPALMPAFPGLAEARSCGDWEPGIPVELDRLDGEDQAYWEEHRGTPKAFLGLAAGQRLFGNRFGNLTAIRLSAPAAARVRSELAQQLDPEALGLFFRDLRGPALAAGSPATDFGGLFLGLSFFLVIAGLMLTALLFVFGVEQRRREVGLLLGVGFTEGRVRGLFVREALLLAGVGATLGALLGIGYAHAVLAGLGSLWQDAVGQTTLTAHLVPGSIVGGAIGAVVAALLAILLTLRRAFRRPAVELLQGDGTLAPTARPGARGPRGLSLGLAVMALAGAITLVMTAGSSSAATAGTFFGAGALVLIAGIFASRHLLLRHAAKRTAGLPTITALGVRNSSRRTGRSLTTIALLASGTFLVVAVQSNRLEPPTDPSVRASGTGGFALFGRSSLPVLRDLATTAGRDAYALDDDDLQGARIVPLRVKDGDDGSCLNLSTPQSPRLVGVDPDQLAQREAFRFAVTGDAGDDNPWRLLDRDLGPGVVPAIGDAASVTWSLHKAVGEALRYRDEAGNEFDVRIVATVSDSILQGNLVIADRHLRERFPSATGFRMFLVDADAERADAVATSLSRALADLGLELTETADRLAAFQAVQNTYLAIFQLLGGLGLLLGTVGLGVVVLRNTLERRTELATLQAVGFSSRDVRRLVVSEHGLLLGLGLLTGLVAAGLAIVPVVRSPDPVAIGPLLGFVALIALSGAFWVVLASALATRGQLLRALHAE